MRKCSHTTFLPLQSISYVMLHFSRYCFCLSVIWFFIQFWCLISPSPISSSICVPFIKYSSWFPKTILILLSTIMSIHSLGLGPIPIVSPKHIIFLIPSFFISFIIEINASLFPCMSEKIATFIISPSFFIVPYVLNFKVYSV